MENLETEYSSPAERYELGKEIGHGGQGTVYESFDKKMSRPVAIKKNSPKNIDYRKTTLNRARLEAQTAGRSDVHPNILTVLDSYTEEEDGELVSLSIVTELKNPEDFVENRIDNNKIDSYSIHAIARDMSSVIDFLASPETQSQQYKGENSTVIHRDLRPGNIVIDGEGKMQKAILTDFGVANKVGVISARGKILGSQNYAPPEIFENPEGTIESEVNTLAKVLYFTATERSLEYIQHGLDAKHRKICIQSLINKGESEKRATQITEAISIALRYNPENRFHSGKEFYEAMYGEV